MVDEQPPAYEGQSMALHVTDTRTTVSPEPEGPPTDDPVIPGKSKPITSHADSPSQWMDETVVGPQVSFASYWARSRAIHVFGSPRSRTPPPTVPSCRCCAETGGGASENCDPITGGTFQLFDDFEGRTTGPNAWGLASSGLKSWTTSAGAGSSASVSGGAGHLVAASSGGFASAALDNIHLKGKLVISFDFTIVSPGDPNDPVGGILIDVGTGGSMPDLTFHLVGYATNADTGPYSQISLLETAHGFYDLPGPPYTYYGAHSQFGATITGSGTCYIVADELGATVLVGGDVFGRINWSDDNTTDLSFVTPFDIASVTFSVFSGASVDIDNINIKDSATYGEVCTPGGTGHAAGDCNESSGEPCPECVDPVTGLDIPDFTPGFMPTFRKQIGDPTTNLDSFICTLEAGAMVLDWQTRGAVSVWGGELIPYCGKTEAQILGTGTSLSNIRQAWLHWDQYLDIRSGGSWADLIAALTEGRAVILQGDYGVFSNAIKCQDSFDGGHAISVYPYQVSDRLLCGDPLCSTFYGIPIAALQDYAEALGASVFGVTSPQKILFAVSRPWVP